MIENKEMELSKIIKLKKNIMANGKMELKMDMVFINIKLGLIKDHLLITKKKEKEFFIIIMASQYKPIGKKIRLKVKL